MTRETSLLLMARKLVEKARQRERVGKVRVVGGVLHVGGATQHVGRGTPPMRFGAEFVRRD